MERLVRTVGNPPARRWATAHWGATLSLLQQTDGARSACYCSLTSGNVPGSCNTCRGCNGAAAPQHPPCHSTGPVASGRQLLYAHPFGAAGGTTQVNPSLPCFCYSSYKYVQQAQKCSWLKVIVPSAGCSAWGPCLWRAHANILVRDSAVGGAAVDQPCSGRRCATGGAAAAAAGRSGAAARLHIGKAGAAGGFEWWMRLLHDA